MAIPKKGSCTIVVDGVTYRWRVRKKPTYSQCYAVWNGGVGDITFSVEHVETPGSVLVVHLPQPHPGINEGSVGVPIVPSQVAQHITQALATGWKATETGSPFHVNAA